ncbi:MAG: triose-phosphate isomerase [Firmicutes bacterium]|nr:triose-phosphate isomerase [Bacillota bacterium]
MRKPLLAANWKMYKTVAESRAYGRSLLQQLAAIPQWRDACDVLICPPAPSIWPLSQVLVESGVRIGAQNVDKGREGAVTGALSGYLLHEAGADFVIVGHSERRQLFAETDEMIAQKVQAAQENRLVPIVCVGETQEQHEAGITEAVVLKQMDAALKNWDRSAPLTLAYEPIWAIGSGQVPAVETVNNLARKMRSQLGREGERVRILYGGSVSSQNIERFCQASDIDGALVGGASLKVMELIAMLKTCVK